MGRTAGEANNYTVHESSIVDPGVEIGEETKVWHFCHVSKGARIGKNCSLGQNVFIGEGVVIGDNVKIQNNVSVYSGVEIEDGVFLGPSCVFTNVNAPRSDFPTNNYQQTLVQRGASIGANATIICGTRIGSFAFIGAGAVIRSDVFPHAIMVGVPAKRNGWACMCGKRLPTEEPVLRAILYCLCGRKYELAGDGPWLLQEAKSG